MADLLGADVEELQEQDISEVYMKRINGKEVLVAEEGETFIFPYSNGSAKLAGKSFCNPNIRPNSVRYRRRRRTPQ